MTLGLSVGPPAGINLVTFQVSTSESQNMAKIDAPIAFELFKNFIFSIADQMALTIYRTTYSCGLRDNMDFLTIRRRQWQASHTRAYAAGTSRLDSDGPGCRG